jgi:membrane protease YdiL (CAAX protease family)
MGGWGVLAMDVEIRRKELPPTEPLGRDEMPRASVVVFGTWVAFVIAALLLLDVLGDVSYAIVVVTGAVVLSVATSQWAGSRSRVDRRDVVWTAVFYLGVVGLFRLAFGVFTADRTAPMFLSFAAGLLLGTVGPIVYTVWVRGRPLRSLGMGLHNLRTMLSLALLFGGVQFAITLWGYDLPAPVDWVPLLVMALVVGVFESIFFRGFLQGRLEASYGRAPAVAVASFMYGAYHVGFGMGASEMVFLTGLGVVYAVAYALNGNLLVLWPLLTPLGSFFAQLESGDLVGKLPWAAILGFADVAGLIIAAIFLANRHERRARHLVEERVVSNAQG